MTVPTTQVILVNELDEPLGSMEKMEAHSAPHLHRAFSIFLFDKQGKMLLQQRAHGKYHSAGLWSNTCCSHPAPGEDVLDAAHRRLMEEMGIDTPLTKAFDFIYQAAFDNGLVEYEFDHVFTGSYDGPINANADEVSNYTYKACADIEDELAADPHTYTPWFAIALPKLKAHLSL